jgi:hypothetical protein
MATIGRFGKVYEKVDLDFDYFEASIRVNPSCSRAALVEFLAEAGTVAQQDEVRAAQLIMRTMREVVHPDDFDRFWTIAKRERQDPQEDILPIAQQVIEATTGFPTGQSSASGTGPASTTPKFAVDLPSPDAPGFDPRTLNGLRITEGRPDLQVAVLRAGESLNGAKVPA